MANHKPVITHVVNVGGVQAQAYALEPHSVILKLESGTTPGAPINMLNAHPDELRAVIRAIEAACDDAEFFQEKA